jgi:hypothetical protein
LEQLQAEFAQEKDQLKDGFEKMLAEQQKQMSAQFQVPIPYAYPFLI